MRNFLKIFRQPLFWTYSLAIIVPLAFLLYLLYINFLPLGFNRNYVITVGAPGDTKVSRFYLEPAPGLSEPKVTFDNIPYRSLTNYAYAVFKPEAVFKNATADIEVVGEGISLIPPMINFDLSTIDWDYAWDLTKKIPPELFGQAFIFNGGAFFDGKSRLELPETINKFENRAFSIYVEWQPQDSNNDLQQIIGHFNWELWQNMTDVTFQVGRLNDKDGPMYTVKYPITASFFNQRHRALAIYNPGDNGYLELYIDNYFVGRTYFGNDKIYPKYGDQNLSLGWSAHNYQTAPHFTGYIYQVNTVAENIIGSATSASLKINSTAPLYLPLVSIIPTARLEQIKLNVSQL